MKKKAIFPRSILLPLIILAASSLFWSSCKPRQGSEVAQAGLTVATFVGPWIASSVDIAMNGDLKSDQSIHYDSKELATSQGRKPAMTIFVADGSYREEIYSLSDSLLSAKAGFWHLFEDSLYMRIDGAGNRKLAFKATVEGKGLLLVSKVDFDADGTSNDQMIVKLKRP